MFYIEEIPRTDSAPFWVTELESIEEIRAWILSNCDITKRHIICETRKGRVIAEGVQITRFYGWNSRNKAPIKVTLDRNKPMHAGLKVFDNEQDAKNHYLESKKQAFERLEKDAEEMQTILASVKAKGIEFDSWANCSDDHGLEYGFCVSCTVNGFYFSKVIDN